MLIACDNAGRHHSVILVGVMITKILIYTQIKIYTCADESPAMLKHNRFNICDEQFASTFWLRFGCLFSCSCLQLFHKLGSICHRKSNVHLNTICSPSDVSHSIGAARANTAIAWSRICSSVSKRSL